jgi:uncharacterized membrane protein YphA (DoxX/SURF4 family)
MDSSQSKALRWTLLALRVILGAIFIYSGYVKLREPWALFAMNIDSYQILPFRFVEPAARVLPWFEIVIGLMMVAGIWMRLSASVLSLTLVIFFSAMVRAKLAGQQINCGCFGSGEPISKWTFLRDGALLAGSLFVAWFAFRRPARKY